MHVIVCVPSAEVQPNLLQLWRATSKFVASNLNWLPTVLKKIETFNKNADIDTCVFRPHVLHHNPGLLDADYHQLAEWLLDQDELSYGELNRQLVHMRKRRMVLWHVEGAPDDVILPDKSMHPLLC